MANGYKKIIKSKELRLRILKLLRFVPDRAMLKLEYRIKTGKALNLRNPGTFNEKLQWLKLNDRKPSHTIMVDKVAVKDYLAEIIDKKHIVRTYGVWNSFDDIDFHTLPNQFVLKCNHDSGSIVICKDKETFDIDTARNVLAKGLRSNAYYYGREWPYKNVKPQVFAEEFLTDEKNPFLPVYKIFCFNGAPKMIQAIQHDKQPDETVDYFDTEWNQMNIRQDFPNSKYPLSKPDCLDDMLILARKLSADEKFIRIDFYEVNNQVYFSEFTFYTDSGFGQFYPEKWDSILGDWLTI